MKLICLRTALTTNDVQPSILEKTSDPEVVKPIHLVSKKVGKYISKYMLKDSDTNKCSIKIVCSPMISAVQTASLIAKSVNKYYYFGSSEVEVIVNPDIHEVGGLHNDKIAATIKSLLGTSDQAQIKPIKNTIPGLTGNQIKSIINYNNVDCSMIDENIGWYNKEKETANDAVQRIKKFAQEIVEPNTNCPDYVILITHPEFMKCFTKIFLGTTKAKLNFAFNPWSISIIKISDEEKCWEAHNYRMHDIDKYSNSFFLTIIKLYYNCKLKYGSFSYII